MTPEQMAAHLIRWAEGNKHVAENKAREIFNVSGDRFYSHVADIIKANGQNRKQRRQHLQWDENNAEG